MIVYRSSSSWKVEKATKEQIEVITKLSSAFILVNIVLWVKFLSTGFVLDEFSSTLDWISLILLVITSLYSFFCPMMLLDGYDWSLMAKFTSVTSIIIGISSLIYVFNVGSTDYFNSDNTQVLDAKVVSKGTWSKKGSFVLSTEDDVLTYENVLNSTDITIGNTVTSISEGELVRTYTDLLGLKTERRMKGFFSKQIFTRRGYEL